MNSTNTPPTREQLSEHIFDKVAFWTEEGNSQALTREQGIQIALWGLKIAGARQELLNHVIAELVELPDNYG